MGFIINPNKRFADNARMTAMPERSKRPNSIRDIFCVSKVHKNGIFQIEDETSPCLYDRCYVFSDVNYVNKDDEQKNALLENLAKFLNSMSADFKITIASEYKDMRQFVDEIFTDIHKDDYPVVSDGIRDWINEKSEDADIHNVEKVMYLTVTTRAFSYEEARSYLLGMDVELGNLFQTLQSVIIPLDAKSRLNTLRKFFYDDEDMTDILIAENGCDPVSSVMPYDLETFSNFMIFNGRQYVSVLFSRNVDPSIAEDEAMRSLSNVPYTSFCTLDYAPVSRSELKAKLRIANINNDRSISQEIDAKNRAGQTMAGISYVKEKRRDELEGYIDQVDENNETCLLIGILVVVTANSEDELATRIKSLKQIGKDCGIALDTYNQVQPKAFNTALPIGCRLVKHMRAFYSSSATALQPFYAQDLTEQGGTFFGRNRTTNHLVFGNRKTLKNPHGIIVGHSGGGKSFLIKSTEVAQTLISTDDDIQIIDPQNEFRSICALYGGQFIDFTPKSEIHVNPMEIPADLAKGDFSGKSAKIDAFVSDVTGWVFSFCSAAMKNIAMTSEHQSFIGECLREIYSKCFSEKQIKVQPTLRDLRDELGRMEKEKNDSGDKQKIHTIYNALQEYTEGAYDMFAYPSNIDINSRFVVFGLANVNADFWEPVMLTIMFFLSNRMEYNKKIRKATRFIVDETQVVTQNPSSADMLMKAVVTFRKFGGICTMAMQNFSRALNNPQLRDMFSNCEYKLFLDQGGIDANNLASIQEFSAKEFHELSQEIPGYGVMVWGKKVILLDSRMSKENPLYKDFSTDFHENVVLQALTCEGEKGISLEVTSGQECAGNDIEKILKMISVVSVTEEEISKALDRPINTVREILFKMCLDGVLQKIVNAGTNYYKIA